MTSFYDEFQLYDDPAKRVGWYDVLDQELKFALVAEILGCQQSIVDLGSGLGDLASFLKEFGHVGEYVGVEKDAALYDEAQALHPEHAFHLQDFTEAPFHQADLAVCIGGLLSEDKLPLSSALNILERYTSFILIGLSASGNSSLRFEPNFVGIPEGENVIVLNQNEVALVGNCSPKYEPEERLERLIDERDYPKESIARAFYNIGNRKRAILEVRSCESELARAMLSAWQ